LNWEFFMKKTISCLQNLLHVKQTVYNHSVSIRTRFKVLNNIINLYIIDNPNNVNA